MEIQNNLLELLSYVGLGNQTANDLSEFNEQQCLINGKDTLEFGCRGDTLNQSLGNVCQPVDLRPVLFPIRRKQLTSTNR